MTVRIANTVRNSRIDDIRAAVDAGSGAGLLRIYSGTKPAKGGTPAGTLLAELTCADPCGSSSSGAGESAVARCVHSELRPPSAVKTPEQ